MVFILTTPLALITSICCNISFLFLLLSWEMIVRWKSKYLFSSCFLFLFNKKSISLFAHSVEIWMFHCFFRLIDTMYDYDLSMSSDIFKQQKHIQLFWVTPNQKERWQLNVWNAEGFLHARDNYVIHDLSKAIHKKEKKIHLLNSHTIFHYHFCCFVWALSIPNINYRCYLIQMVNKILNSIANFIFKVLRDYDPLTCLIDDSIYCFSHVAKAKIHSVKFVLILKMISC